MLRDEIEPPFDPLDYPSPLAGFRHFTKQATDDAAVHRDRPRSRATASAWPRSTRSRASSGTSPAPRRASAVRGRTSSSVATFPAAPLVTPVAHGPVEITISGYQDVWVPGVGYADRLPAHRRRRRGALRRPALQRRDGQHGAHHRARARATATGSTRSPRRRRRSRSSRTCRSRPSSCLPSSGVPDIVTLEGAGVGGHRHLARGAAGGDPAQAHHHGLPQPRRCASDAVPSRAGHGADRMIELLERPQMIGDEEQYASAFALMARSLGYPARVVMGFAPEVAEGGGSVTVTGDDVTAWVEVAFDGVGWVPFDPTPDETDIPQDQMPKPQSEPQPQVRQPPRTDKEPEDLLTPRRARGQRQRRRRARLRAARLGVRASASALLIARRAHLPADAHRRCREGAPRAQAPQRSGGADQAAGAWEELVDRYSELGYDVPPKLTRSLVATTLETQFPATEQQAPPRLRVLASETDELVFSGPRSRARRERRRVWTDGARRRRHRRAHRRPPRTRLLSRYRRAFRTRSGRAADHHHRTREGATAETQADPASAPPDPMPTSSSRRMPPRPSPTSPRASAGATPTSRSSARDPAGRSTLRVTDAGGTAPRVLDGDFAIAEAARRLGCHDLGRPRGHRRARSCRRRRRRSSCVVEGPDAGTEFPLAPGTVFIGRDASLSDLTLSRHARLEAPRPHRRLQPRHPPRRPQLGERPRGRRRARHPHRPRGRRHRAPRRHGAARGDLGAGGRPDRPAAPGPSRSTARRASSRATPGSEFTAPPMPTEQDAAAVPVAGARRARS